MRHSYQILILCFTIIIALLVYTLSENRNYASTSHSAWLKYDESFDKLMHISVMLNQMQHLSRIYMSTTTTDDFFELDELIISASAARSIYIQHYLELENLNLDKIEKQYLNRVNKLAGKSRLAQMSYDEILSQRTPLKQRLDLAIRTIISPQSKTQAIMQDLLHYIRTNTISNSNIYREQADIGRNKNENLQLTTIYFTFFLGIFSILIVIKALKTIQDKNNALSKAEGFLHSTLNSTPIALIIITRAGQIIMANNNAVKLFHYSQKQLTSMNISQLLPEKIRKQHIKYFLSYCDNPINREMNNDLNVTALRQSGQIFPAEVGLSPVDGQDELYIACSIKDITTQKAMQKEILENKNKAEQANQAKSDFLANVSHELRTPLHAILSFSRLGLKNLDKQSELSSIPKIKNYLDKIHTSGEKLLGFINDLLDSAKFESGKMELEYLSQDMGQLVEAFINEQEARLHELAIKVSVSASSYNQQALFDKHYIGQTINNLLSNAIKHSPQGGVINISITSCQYNNKHAIQFAIQDEGSGIPENQLDFIFEKFVQSSNKISGGTGLGLSLCKNIIQAHGGKIWAENVDAEKRQASGARFSFIIPDK